MALEAEAGVTPAWQVGEWVERLGEKLLKKRQAKLDAMERNEWPEEPSSPISIIPTKPGAATTAAITVRDIDRASVPVNPTTGAIPREKPQWLWVGLAGAVLFGGIGGIVALIVGRDRKAMIPFGPYMAAGAVVGAFWGEPIADWYLRSFSATLV